MDQNKRIGNFTSSQISRLCGFARNKKDPSKAFYGYCREKFLERKMGRPIHKQVKTIPMKWGSLMEVVLFNLLGIEYEMTHKQTIIHPKYNFYSGTPDLIAPIKAGEIKSYEPLKFSAMTVCILQEDVQKFKLEYPEEYWQSVSNAVLTKKKRTEIITYMPYKSELLEIIKKVEDENFLESNGLNPSDYYFLGRDDIESLPYLPDDSKMSNVNSFEFELPEEDVVFLLKRIIMAEKEVQRLFN